MWQANFILQNGQVIPYTDAKVHPMSLGMTYATALFEGMRAYRNPQTGEFKIFRLAEHMKRLQTGMKVMRFDRKRPGKSPRLWESRMVRLTYRGLALARGAATDPRSG